MRETKSKMRQFLRGFRPAFLMVVCCSAAPVSELWTFDRIDSIGGHPTTVLGHPRVIDTPAGKAVAFNGVDDALFLDLHPLAGAETFTWEVIFRPDADGKPEQRFFHMQERDPKTGSDTTNRLLFEIRIINGLWCVDSFVKSADGTATLLNRKKLHPFGPWYHAAMVYDGRWFRNYINGEEEGAAQVHLTPQGAGHTSVGVRINKIDYFKGAILQSRMSRRALSPSDFLKAR